MGFESNDFYYNLQEIEATKGGIVWTYLGTRSSFNLAPKTLHKCGKELKFVPNLRQLVEVVEWGIFVAKSAKNSLGLGAWVAHAWWRRGGRR